MIPRESDFATKQESSTSDGTKISKAAASSNNPTSSWSRLKDPRVVRVSRAFGGKDRHSKVCTIRGLRDRRVRLSVPTAIQLYDLQDRLGLNQPSKVVDWLLNAAKHEIDELPPLQIPPGSLIGHNLDQPIDELRSDKQQGLNINDSINWNDQVPLKETSSHIEENWARNEEGRQFISLQENFLSRQNPSSLLNNTIPYNSLLRLDPSNLTLSHPPRSYELTTAAQTENLHNFSFVPMQSTMSVPSGSHQVLVYQPGMSTQSYFPFQIPAAEIDQKQVHFQSSELSNDSTSDQPARKLQFSMTENFLPSQNGGAGERGKQRQ